MCWQDAQRRLMSRGVWTSVLTSNHSHRNKILRARNKVAHVELLRGLARPVHKTETKYIIGLFILLLISMLLLNISIISILIKVKNCYKICTFKIIFISNFFNTWRRPILFSINQSFLHIYWLILYDSLKDQPPFILNLPNMVSPFSSNFIIIFTLFNMLVSASWNNSV